MSRFALTTYIWIAIGTIIAIFVPLKEFYWLGSLFYASYLAVFISGLCFIRMNYFCRAVCRASPGQMRIALTFDDGPDPAATPRVLDLLKREQIPAAFFCIGKNVSAHPDLARRIADDGHLLANHSYTHPWYINLLLAPALNRQMEQTQDALEAAAGVRPKYFRPPSGLTGPVFLASLKKSGLTLVGWDVRSLDTVLKPQAAIARVLRLTHDGSIILLHDGWSDPNQIAEIVSTIITELKVRGFTFERLDRLLENSLAPALGVA